MDILVCTFSFPCFENNIHDGRFVYSEVIGFAESGNNVIVLTPHFSGSAENEYIHKKIKVIRFPYFYPKKWQILKRPGKPIYDINSIFAFFQIPILCILFSVNIFIHSRHVEIIHAQWTTTALLALPTKYLRRKKLVMTARGSDIHLMPKWLNKLIFRNVDAAIDCFGDTAWNEQIKKDFKASYLKLPLLVLDDYSGNTPKEIEKARDKDNSVFILLFVGRFHTIKTTENKLPIINLLHAVNLLQTIHKNIQLFYIGDGDKNITDELSENILKLNLTDKVELLGPKTNVIDYMRHCDLGIGGIATNAVSQEFTICKKPQLLMKTEDNENTIWKDGHNCLLVEPDDITKLANKIEYALNSKEMIIELGINAAIDTQDNFIESKVGASQYINSFNMLFNK